MNNLLIRADATTETGTGHIMRCLALAQAWQMGGNRAFFLSHCGSEALRQRVEATGVGFIPLDHAHHDPADLQTMLTLLSELQAGVVVVDGYHFDPAYHQAVRKKGVRLLLIDDTAHLPEYHADILLNQNINAGQLSYMCDTDTKLLLGPQYALLRPEFLPWHGQPRKISRLARKVLVTMGGSDPENVTLKVIQAMQQVDVPGLETRIIVGSANPHFETLNHAVHDSTCNVQLFTDVPDMSEQTAWADLAVSAGGSTCWELAFMGVPTIVLVLAENQHNNAEELGKNSITVNLGWHEQILPSQISQAVTQLVASYERRSVMAQRGRELVDGYGAERVLMRMRGDRIRLRHVREKDKRLIWEWANESDTRAVSFSSESIPWERHLQWFASKLSDPHCIFYVVLNEEEIPIGQVRYEVSGNEATISISLSARYCGKGYGSAVVMLASRQFYLASQARAIHAYIKTGNEISMQTFSKAGFRPAGAAMVHGQPSAHMILPKEAIA